MPQHILTAVAWPYANGPRHIGHVSGFGVPSDIFSRYQRMAGNKVLMVSGTDEHGTPIQVQADKEGLSARELADRYNAIIAQDLHDLGMSYDLFTRTTTRNHYEVVQEIFKGLYDNGYIFPRRRWARFGRTLPDRYIEGTCPICGYDCARRPVRQLRQPARLRRSTRCRGSTGRSQFVETGTSCSTAMFTEALGRYRQAERFAGVAADAEVPLNLLDDLQPRAISRTSTGACRSR